MKYLKTLLVLVVVLGFPAGSWLFLQHGLDWRKEKRDQLVPKTNLVKDHSWTQEELSLLKSTFDRRTTLLLSNDRSENALSVIDQFKDAYTFQFKKIDNLPASILSKLKAESYQYLIVDTGMVVRQTYLNDDKATINTLVEDLALIVPQRKEKDIKVRGHE